MAGKNDVRKFDTEEAVAVDLADYIAALSEKFIKEKGSFTIVLSGNTPIQTLRKLLEAPYSRTVDWVNWLVFWVDERVGPLTDPNNNYNRAKQGFLSKTPIPENNFYPMMPIGGSPTPAQAAEYYEKRLKNLVQTKVLPKSTSGYPQFDLMLLGLDPSGLVASLFPNRDQLSMTAPWVTFVPNAPTPPESRTTFTVPTINSCSEIAIVAMGIELSLPVYVMLTIPRRPGVKLLPVEKVSPQKKLTWFLDENAAFQL